MIIPSAKTKIIKAKRCSVCGNDYFPVRAFQPTCDEFLCKVAFAEKAAEKSKRKREKRAKEEAAADRRETKEKLDQIKRRSEWLEAAQKVVNRYVRLRDRHCGCISCDKPATWRGQWHASHYRSVGAASAVRFNVFNIHKACSVCNHRLSGNVAAYKPRLIEKIGADKVEWLDAQNQTVRYDIEYLKRLKKIFSKRANRLARKIRGE